MDTSSQSSEKVGRMMPAPIYLSAPDVNKDDRDALIAAFDSNWISTVGPHLDQFEKGICELLGVQYAVGLSSGTAAIHLALKALGIQRGDEVLCSTLTFCASANPIVYEGATPVFIDSDLRSWNLDPAIVEEEIRSAKKRGKLPSAIIAVDLFGQCADIDSIREIAAPYKIPIIEDAAEALGSTYHGRSAGSLGDVSILSFNGNKMISTSGGGMLCTNRREIAEFARHLATQARQPVPHYQHEHIGYNYRLSNLLAALGASQLKSLPEKVERRRYICQQYSESIATIPGITMMPEATFGQTNRWLSAILIDPVLAGFDRQQLYLHLQSENIESRPVWKPLHRQPSFQDARFCGGSVAEKLFEDGLCLPSGSGLTQFELQRVIQTISHFANSSKPKKLAA